MELRSVQSRKGLSPATDQKEPAPSPAPAQPGAEGESSSTASPLKDPRTTRAQAPGRRGKGKAPASEPAAPASPSQTQNSSSSSNAASSSAATSSSAPSSSGPAPAVSSSSSSSSTNIHGRSPQARAPEDHGRPNVSATAHAPPTVTLPPPVVALIQQIKAVPRLQGQAMDRTLAGLALAADSLKTPELCEAIAHACADTLGDLLAEALALPSGASPSASSAPNAVKGKSSSLAPHVGGILLVIANCSAARDSHAALTAGSARIVQSIAAVIESIDDEKVAIHAARAVLCQNTSFIHRFMECSFPRHSLSVSILSLFFFLFLFF